MTALLSVVFLTLFVSAACSLFEAVLYSTRMATLEAERLKGHRQVLAELFIRMKRRISAPIAAILILNTVANTAGAAVAGMLATRELGTASVPVVTASLPIGILFFSEILTTTRGAVYWRTVWPLVVWPLTILRILLAPAIWLVGRFQNLVAKGEDKVRVSEDEILALVRMGAQAGEITQDESQLVRNIIELENHLVRDIMTPRAVLFSQNASRSLGHALDDIVREGFTRVLLYEEEPENIVGYVMVHDLLTATHRGKRSLPLKSLSKEIPFVPKSVNCLALLTRFLKERRHIAVVLDEYGGVAGLVTLEDLIETLLGEEIVDERDRFVDLQETARERHRRPEMSDGQNGNGRESAEPADE